jgi:hypothetical protein
MPIAARSYQGSTPTSTISWAKNECAVRMIDPMLKPFFARSIATEKGWRSAPSSRRTSSRGMPKGAIFIARAGPFGQPPSGSASTSGPRSVTPARARPSGPSALS